VLKLPYPKYNCAYIIFIPMHCLDMALGVDGRNFSAIKNSITVHCLHCTPTHPFISTGTELELWTAVGSRLCMVERRYHMTVCFCPKVQQHVPWITLSSL